MVRSNSFSQLGLPVQSMASNDVLSSATASPNASQSVQKAYSHQLNEDIRDWALLDGLTEYQIDVNPDFKL